MSSLVSCGTKSSVADDINDPSVPYDPEPYAEQQISTIEEYIQPEENAEQSSLSKYYDVDDSDIAEIQSKCHERSEKII